MRQLFNLAFAVCITAAVLAPVSTATAAVIGGGDYGGGDLLPADGDTLSGTFTNVGTFHIAAGDMVFVDLAVPLSVAAALIDIDGTLDGTGAGSAGGASVPNIPVCVPSGTVTGIAGSGPGGGSGGRFGCNVHGSGGGGGGYGGVGGNSGQSIFDNAPPAPGGVMFGDATSPSINLGSGGGSGSSYNEGLIGSSGAGGAGGAAISLFGTVDLDGAILADGANGALPIGENGAGGGGGSGGGVLLDGSLSLNGLISATGGAGVTNTLFFFSSGGGGAGGRIKLFGCSSNGQGFISDVSGGGFDQSRNDFGDPIPATAGGAGTIHNGATAQCVDIDIKFCSNPNGYNCKSRGVTPVTIFGTQDFDATDIIVSTLQLCLTDLSDCTDSEPKNSSQADRGDPTTDIGAAQCTVIDGVEQDFRNPDGETDLDVAFHTQDVVNLIGCDTLSKGDASPTLVLIGETNDGSQFTSVPIGDVGVDQLLIQKN